MRAIRSYNAWLLGYWWIAGITARDLSIKVVDRFCALFDLIDQLLAHIQDSPTFASHFAMGGIRYAVTVDLFALIALDQGPTIALAVDMKAHSRCHEKGLQRLGLTKLRR
jgi:hypothetical protein